MEELNFEGRTVIVTGAGRGIGRAYALLLASRGAGVVVADLGASTDGMGVDGDDPAADVVAEIEAAGGRAVGVRADVSTQEGAQAIVDAAVAAFGGVDAVINNAGIVRVADWLDVPAEEYQRHLEVHYLGSLWLARAAWPHLKESGSGRIVNTISPAMLGNPMMVHYGSSKGAVYGLTRNLALEGMEHNILVNAVSPGAGTRMAEAAADSLSAEIMEYMRTALTPELVAPLGVYLAHPSSEVTGEAFNVAGGMVNRMAVVNTQGIYDTELTVESIASSFDQIMTINEAAQPQVVAVAAMPDA
jgi:NAD(P)-dependent dehydrogenase (short-subunit alcohol dehydrogenase family)